MTPQKQEKQDERPATEAQIKLANALETELNYAESVPDEVLRTQSRTVVSDYIHKLKEMKVRDQALRAANNNVPQFDKIALAMLYKVYITDADKTYFENRCRMLGKTGAMTEVYDEYKKVQEGVRKHVAESVKP